MKQQIPHVCRGIALGAALAFGTMAAAPLAALAHGNIWMDENVPENERMTKYKDIVVFPIHDQTSADGRPDQYQAWNQEFAKRINKRIKRTNFHWFEDPSDAKAADKKKEKLMITRENSSYKDLLQHFPSEEARGKAVYDKTGAEGYLLPHLRYYNERVDVSPATWTNVKMESYYDVENGPNGDQNKLGYQSWYASHLIPEHRRTLEMVDFDFVLYDAYTQKKAMTLIDYYRCYDVDKTHAFEQIAKNFTGDWNRLKDDHENDVPAGAPTLGFRSLDLPWNAAQDEFALKTIYYAYKDEAGDTLKGGKVDYQPNGGRYYVTGAIKSYDRGERWTPPSASTYTSLDRTEEFTWYDRNGNAHKGKRKYYKTNINDNFGYNSFYYGATADLSLVDSRTGETVLHRILSAEDPDRYANALRQIFGDFYREVDKTIGVKA